MTTLPILCIAGKLDCYRPQTKLQKGNVFTSMCQEFCPWGEADTPRQTPPGQTPQADTPRQTPPGKHPPGRPTPWEDTP